MSIKINDAELEALYGLPHLAIVVYLMAIRPRMDYATGIVGRKARISWRALAEWVYLEPGPGLSDTGTPHISSIRRAVGHLIRAGIVEQRGSSADRELFFRCRLADLSSFARKQPDSIPTDLTDSIPTDANAELERDYAADLGEADRPDNEEADKHLVSGKPSTPPSSSVDVTGLREDGGGAKAKAEVKAGRQNSTVGGSTPKSGLQGEGGDSLIWPTCIAEAQQTAVRAILSGLDAQALLDELAGSVQRGTIRYPIRLLESLAKKARSGTWIPDAGLAIAAARANRAIVEASRKASEEKIQAVAPRSAPPAEVAAMLKNFTRRKPAQQEDVSP